MEELTIEEAQKLSDRYDQFRKKDALIGTISLAVSATCTAITVLSDFRARLIVFGACGAAIACLKFANVRSYGKRIQMLKQYIEDADEADENVFQSEYDNQDIQK